MKKVRAKCGCEGCIFEHSLECPGYDGTRPELEACTENGTAMILVSDDTGEEDESRV